MVNLSGAAANGLLDRLCVVLGFCLAPDDRKLICERPPDTAGAFADSVIRADGLDPLLLDSQLYRQVLGVVEAAFEEEAAAQQELISRNPAGVLFEVEHIVRERPRYLICRQLDSKPFNVSRSALNGHRVSPFISQPRARYTNGAPRFDLFCFHLESPTDINAFKVGQLALLTEELPG